MEAPGSLPLPEDPALAAMAVALRDAGHWADVVDRDWRLVYSTEDHRRICGGLTDLAAVALGEHYFGPEHVSLRLRWRSGPNTVDQVRELFGALGELVLADTAGGRDQLRKLVHPVLRDIIDQLPVHPSPTRSVPSHGMHVGVPALYFVTTVRIHDATGRHVGTALIMKPGAGMAVLATLAVGIDQRHFQRMQHVAKAGRRPAAIMFADLEASSPLTRRLPTASYFAFARRLARVADQSVIDAGGLVGRHVGDGLVAFFLAETAGSESAAAAGACIAAARTLRGALADVATRSDLAAEEVVLRFGLHWGSTLYVGQIATSGRTEVTALGDEVNETARIEACATGGRTLASKVLVERLSRDDAADLGLDPDRVTYTPLADLATATEKARRDAPAIAVCEV